MSDPYKKRLKDFLSEDVSAAVDRERSEFDRLAAPHGDRIVLWGAGGIGRKTLAGLRRAGIEPLTFADSFADSGAPPIDGLQVLNPEEAVTKFGDNATFVITIWRGVPNEGMRDHVANLRALGCRTIVPFGLLYWKYAEQFLPHYAIDLPRKVIENRNDIETAYDLLCDDASRREFVQQIAWRLRMAPDEFDKPADHEMYFPPNLVSLRDDEVFIDCGAFDGDTIDKFLIETGGKFGKIVAFEPDPVNLASLQRTVAKLPATTKSRIRVVPAGVGDFTGTLSFSADGTVSSAICESGDAHIDCVTLDDALLGEAPTFVKIDIEGYELNALDGARRILRDDRPILAVCSYHEQAHIWEIPLRIHKLQPDYALFQVRYAVDAWETVTYAIPRERLIDA